MDDELVENKPSTDAVTATGKCSEDTLSCSTPSPETNSGMLLETIEDYHAVLDASPN